MVYDSSRTQIVRSADVPQHSEAPVRVVPAWASPPNTRVLVMLGDTLSDQASSLRVIRHRIERYRAEGKWSFAITSARDGEGKSTFAAQLALVLSESQRARVLLIEANFRNPGLANILGFAVARDSGFSNQIVRKMRGNNDPWSVMALGPALHVLAESTVEGRFPEALHSTQFEAAVGTLARSYDFVIIDSPSILTSGDAHVVESVADGMIVVARSGQSKGGDLRQALRRLNTTKALGVILWDTPPTKAKKWGRAGR